MASIRLKFVPPEDSGYVTLQIYESDASDGSYQLIDSTSAGNFPDYINEYTTDKVLSTSDWFVIQWVDNKGGSSEPSEPIKGGTATLIGEIVDRVMLRDSDLNENIVVQETEATVSYIYRVDDPYSIDINTVSPLWLTELTNLALVASLYVTVTQISSTGQEYTAGMISERSTANTDSLKNLDQLEKRSLKRLGIGGSLIAAIDNGCYTTTVIGEKCITDSSRLLSTREILKTQIVARDLESGELITPNV